MATVDCYQTGDYGYFGVERDPDYYRNRGPIRPRPVLEHMVGRPVDWMMHVCHPYYIPNQPPPPPPPCCCHGPFPPDPHYQWYWPWAPWWRP